MIVKEFIYGLVDPRSGEVRYIGLSSSGLRRPRQHFTGSALAKDRTYKGNWLRQLKAAGGAPEIRVLEKCARVDLPEVEKFWIAQGRGLGWPLVNLTKGGDGTFGRQATPETRAKMAAWARTPELCAKLSAMALGKKMSAKACEKMRRAKLGKKQTAESNAKRRAAQLGRKRDPSIAARGWETRRARKAG